MNCAEFEILLADYLDNTLPAPERAAVQQHMLTCTGCREFFQDASGALNFLKRADEITVPAELVTRIAYAAPTGRVRDSFEQQGFLSKLISKWLQPVLQPRLVMGMAMTILSFAMLERCTGVRVQQIQAADLSPFRIWGGVEDKAMRFRDRAVKYYENLRWVYEIEVRLRSLQDAPETAPEQTDRPQGQKDRGAAGSGSGTTRSGSETNGDKR
jgi:anti-sigma factor RsiW